MKSLAILTGLPAGVILALLWNRLKGGHRVSGF